jgi:hypothetical protein
MVSKYCLVLAVALIVLTVGFAQAEVLANSGKPMRGVNPQRNYNVNKKLLCPEIAPGRTQVWNIAWETKKPSQDWTSYYAPYIELTQDDEGFIYLRGSVGTPAARFIKINGTDGSFDPTLVYVAPFNSFAEPTHVAGNRMYIAAETKTAIVNTLTMQEIALLDHAVTGTSPGSYAPFGTQFMITASPANSPVDALRYLNTASQEFDVSQPNFSSANANDVIIYKNGTGDEIPIAVFGSSSPSAIIIYSPNYLFSLLGSNYLYVDSYVQDSQLVIHAIILQTQTTHVTLIIDADTGNLIRNVSMNTWEGEAITAFSKFRVLGDKSVCSIVSNSQAKIVDILNDKVLLTNKYTVFDPLYSIRTYWLLFH